MSNYPGSRDLIPPNLKELHSTRLICGRSSFGLYLLVPALRRISSRNRLLIEQYVISGHFISARKAGLMYVMSPVDFRLFPSGRLFSCLVIRL